jgi:uncharacterized DUF497 family protein
VIRYTFDVVFTWDPKKAAANQNKQEIDFQEAATVLSDTLATTFPDPDHSTPADERFVTIRMSDRNQILVVVHSDEPEVVRIISARRATRRERKFYEEEQ